MPTYVKHAAAALAVSAAILASVNPAAADPTFPDKCKGDMSMSGMPMGGEMPMGSQQMPMGGQGSDTGQGPMANLTDYQKASMEAMMSMNQQMMQGMIKDEADVAFICGLIAHHLGAIDMAKIELEHGDNEEAKATAQKVIDDQTKEVERLTEWVEKEVKE
ncbi:MAG: DUF305 domain-containing protein [Pseudorhizobium sp.]